MVPFLKCLRSGCLAYHSQLYAVANAFIGFREFGHLKITIEQSGIRPVIGLGVYYSQVLGSPKTLSQPHFINYFFGRFFVFGQEAVVKEHSIGVVPINAEKQVHVIFIDNRKLAVSKLGLSL